MKHIATQTASIQVFQPDFNAILPLFSCSEVDRLSGEMSSQIAVSQVWR